MSSRSTQLAAALQFTCRSIFALQSTRLNKSKRVPIYLAQEIHRKSWTWRGTFLLLAIMQADEPPQLGPLALPRGDPRRRLLPRPRDRRRIRQGPRARSRRLPLARRRRLPLALSRSAVTARSRDRVLLATLAAGRGGGAPPRQLQTQRPAHGGVLDVTERFEY